ncbi:MAG: aldose epimerase family protein [Natronospirillum sp.]
MAQPGSPVLTEHPWTSEDTHLTARLFCLRNEHVEIWLTDAGASIYRLRTPDIQGNWNDIACAPRRLEAFWNHPAYMGATIGRVANRIGKACLTLDNKEYRLIANESANTLHGGESWHRDRWQVKTMEYYDSVAVEFCRYSPNGEGGFPGNVEAKVRYRLTSDANLQVEFSATTDATTVVNMTNHTYYNLNGADYQSLTGHQMHLPADFITEVDEESIPTGELLAVPGTPFDFTRPADLLERLSSAPPEFEVTTGIDHNFAYKPVNSPTPVLMAHVVNTLNGRTLTLRSTQPGLQLYTGNYMAGLEGPDPTMVYQRQQAFCLEPQHYPDSPNKANFPGCTVTPDQPYAESMVLSFGVTEQTD